MIRSVFWDQFFIIVTWAGSLAILLPVAGLLITWLMANGYQRQTFFLIISFVGTVALSHALKCLIARPRPIPVYILVPMPGGWSFPSAHSAQITAFCLCITLLLWRVASLATVIVTIACSAFLIVMVGLSRVYLQVHYPSDVWAGFFIGGMWTIAIYFMILQE